MVAEQRAGRALVSESREEPSLTRRDRTEGGFVLSRASATVRLLPARGFEFLHHSLFEGRLTMARRESHKEDLLREATALVERGEFRVEGFGENVVIGFRRDGSGSVFVGQDQVYHFNPQGSFRRGYQAGLLIKVEQDRLVGLERQRTAEAVLLVRREFDGPRQAQFCEQARQCLQTLHLRFTERRFATLGKVPEDAPLEQRITSWLAERGQQFRLSPT
jgi:hypothetical protein